MMQGSSSLAHALPGSGTTTRGNPMTFRPHTKLVALLLFIAAVLAGPGCKSEPPKPGQAEFDAASGKIDIVSDQIAFGSDAAATEMAKKFSARIKKLDTETFEGGKDAEKDFATKGNFLTYCHTRGNNIVFLVQAPNLDTYSGDVRKALFEIAWRSAQEVTGKPASKTIVVALRGKLLYGAIGGGKANGPAPSPRTGTALDPSELWPYFASTPAAAAAAPAPARP
jgi:hypothetical protein